MNRENGDIRQRGIPFLTALAVAVSAFCDIPAYFSVGGATGSAILTALTAGLGILSLPALIRAGSNSAVRPMLPFIIFTTWSTFLFIVKGTGINGLQTISMLWAFLSIVLTTASFTTAESAAVVRRNIFRAGWAVGLLYSIVLLQSGIGGGGFIGRRSFALEGLIIMAAAVPFVVERARSPRWLPGFLLILISASLSRTALVVGAVLLAIRTSITKRGLRLARLLFLGASAGAVLLWAISSIPELRDRFLGGDQAFSFFGLSISSQGRNNIWGVLLDGVGSSPIIGHGPGAIRVLISTLIPGEKEPHNDFLRALYDTGWVGMVMLVGAVLALLIATGRRALRADSPNTGAPHVGAFLALAAFVLGALTDNPIVYDFVMFPLAVIVGLSLRESLPETIKEVKPRQDGLGNGQRGGLRRVTAHIDTHLQNT